MSDYTKITDFAAKDSMLAGNPLKEITGTAHDDEYNAIAVAIATKVDTSGALGTPTSGTLTNCTGLPAAGVTGTALVSAAIGTTVQAYDADIPTVTASQAEMESGTEAALRSMSPLRVAQAIAALSGAVGIQPISASVAANALTISASALSLDFRSTTLGSGTVTTVTGTPADLVISSGSTLGTVSAEKSRIAVLALNNAGTIELAAVNISGGVDLTETGLISTTAEGGAGAADSATVVYSTTARTNVAYRVIGYIESTQATAGTWATAPSTIQGQGGQALAAMSSLGYGQTWQSVTRNASTTYYNTTGRPIVVALYGIGTALGTCGVAATIGGVAVNAYTGGGWSGGSGNTYVPAQFIVPANMSYSYTASNWTYQSASELR